jgi:hypothetical protein
MSNDTKPYRIRFQYPDQPEYSSAYWTISEAVIRLSWFRERGAAARLGVPDGRKFRELSGGEVRAALDAAGDSDLAGYLDTPVAKD